MDILQFSARVLVAQARGCQRAVTLLPDTVLPMSSFDVRSGFPALAGARAEAYPSLARGSRGRVD